MGQAKIRVLAVLLGSFRKILEPVSWDETGVNFRVCRLDLVPKRNLPDLIIIRVDSKTVPGRTMDVLRALPGVPVLVLVPRDGKFTGYGLGRRRREIIRGPIDPFTVVETVLKICGSEEDGDD